MGFFDKMFGAKEAAAPEGWQLHERTDLGLKFSCPADWRISGIEGGIEVRPPDSGRVTDPSRGKEVSTPRVELTAKDAPGADKMLVKEMVKSRSGEYPDYRFVKHVSNSVKNADSAVVYEFQYGSGENIITALSALALGKKRLLSVVAAGARTDFEKHRVILERVISSLQVI